MTPTSKGLTALLVVLALLDSVSTQSSSARASQSGAQGGIPEIADIGGVLDFNSPNDIVWTAWNAEVEKYRKLCPVNGTLTLTEEARQIYCISVKMGLGHTMASFIIVLKRITGSDLRDYIRQAWLLGGDCEKTIPKTFNSEEGKKRVFFFECVNKNRLDSSLRYSQLGLKCLRAGKLVYIGPCAPTALVTQASLNRGLMVMTEARNAVLRKGNFGGLPDCGEAFEASQNVFVKTMDVSGFLYHVAQQGKRVNSTAIQEAIDANPNVGLPDIQTLCNETDPHKYAKCVGMKLAAKCAYYLFQLLADAYLPVGRR